MGIHGIVSLVCLSRIDDDFIFLDTFLMSCRVLGRHLESWILSEIVKRIKKKNARFLIAEFVDTKRNSLALQFLNNYGFEKVIKGSDLSRKINSNKLDTKGTIHCLDINDLVIPNLEIYGVSKNES
jgi:predicted enzyme involved in methoxymalonyl-ACP biosynthesis